MSKKSRKRNRNLLKAAALIGGLAMMGRGRGTGVSGSDKAKFTSDAAYTGDVTGTEYPGANQATVAKTSYGKGYGHPIIQGNVIRKKAFEDKMTTPGMGTAVAPPSILNPYNRFANKQKLRTYKSGGSAYKSGG